MFYSIRLFFPIAVTHGPITTGLFKFVQIISNYFIVRLKVDQRAGQLSLPQLGINKTEKIELKHKTDEQISPVNGLEP